jgi:hypothetical protein
MSRHGIGALVGLVSLLAGSAVNAADPAEPTENERAAHRARMDELSQTITVEELVGDARLTAIRQQAPLLVYNDDTRRNSGSTLWVWTQQNRPVAVAAVELYPMHPTGPRWLFELVSLSDHRLSAVRAPELKWTARDAADAWRPLDTTEPAASAVGRLVQMRDALRRFRAWERAEVDGRIELRPMTTPLMRYAHEASGVVDGALFAFANGTNPEVLIVFEASRSAAGESVWQYRLGQMTGAAVTVEYQDKPVWERGNADPPAVRPSYVNGWFSAKESAPLKIKDEAPQ